MQGKADNNHVADSGSRVTDTHQLHREYLDLPSW